MKKILVLGAGLVSKPGIHYLDALDDVQITVASLYIEEAEAVVKGCKNTTAMPLNVRTEPEKLERLISLHDIAVSLLPATEHVSVAKHCLMYKKHMATASYISPEMKELDETAKDCDIVILNECGVDPGMDHMSAMRVIDEAREKGGKVTSFRSYCGGLPAPEANTNPIGYKFSWAPRGVLVAATNPAVYLHDSEEVQVDGVDLFKAPEKVEIKDAGTFEGYPNRNSLGYVEMYGLEGVETMFRGTLRNQTHCEAWYHWAHLGMFDQTLREDIKDLTYLGFMKSFVDGDDNVKAALAKKFGLDEDAKAITNMEWLGMFDDEPIGLEKGGNVDIVAKRMLERCQYHDGERDMLAMQHEFIIKYEDRTEKVFSSMVDYGIKNGDSSMARTVSLPLAIAVRMILNGKIKRRGVIAPITPNVYNPILDELAELGITFAERIEVI